MRARRPNSLCKVAVISCRLSRGIVLVERIARVACACLVCTLSRRGVFDATRCCMRFIAHDAAGRVRLGETHSLTCDTRSCRASASQAVGRSVPPNLASPQRRCAMKCTRLFRVATTSLCYGKRFPYSERFVRRAAHSSPLWRPRSDDLAAPLGRLECALMRENTRPSPFTV